MSATIVSPYNTKGGILRTTLVVNLAMEYALLGFRVLVVDFAGSPHAGYGLLPDLAWREFPLEKTAYQLLFHPEQGVDDLAIPVHFFLNNIPQRSGDHRITPIKHVQLTDEQIDELAQQRHWHPQDGLLRFVPGTNPMISYPALTDSYYRLYDSEERKLQISKALAKARESYDLIFIDLSGSDANVEACLHAADAVFIPWDLADGLGLMDVKRTISRCDEITQSREALDLSPLQVIGVARIKDDMKEKKGRVWEREWKKAEALPVPILQTSLPYDSRQDLGLPVQFRAPESPLAEAVNRLALEMKELLFLEGVAVTAREEASREGNSSIEE
jgi:cellulose biosynthesis protein BcsQ